MPLEQADKNTYTSRIDTDIQTAKDTLKGQVGIEGVNIETAIKAAKTSIDTNRSSIVSSIESRTEKGLDAAIDAAKFIKTINDKAKIAMDSIDTNAEAFKKKHEATIAFTKVRAELLDPKIKDSIWAVENQVKGERGVKKAGEFTANVSNASQLKGLELNLRGLRNFCDEARTVRFITLEPKSKELERIKVNLGDADPALTVKIDAMLISVNEKIAGFKKVEGLYDTKLAEVKASLAQQIEREAQKEKGLLEKSGTLQEKNKNKPVSSAELTTAYIAWQNQRKFVRGLRAYVGFVGKKQTTGYKQDGKESSPESTGTVGV